MKNRREKTRLIIETIRTTSLHFSSGDHFSSFRSICYSAAATCLVALLALTQIPEEARHADFKVSLYAGAIALPIWLGLGMIIDNYLWLGQNSYDHFNTIFMRRSISALRLAAAAATVACVGAAIHIESAIACDIFIATGILMYGFAHLQAFAFISWCSANGKFEGTPSKSDGSKRPTSESE